MSLPVGCVNQPLHSHIERDLGNWISIKSGARAVGYGVCQFCPTPGWGGVPIRKPDSKPFGASQLHFLVQLLPVFKFRPISRYLLHGLAVLTRQCMGPTTSPRRHAWRPRPIRGMDGIPHYLHYAVVHAGADVLAVYRAQPRGESYSLRVMKRWPKDLVRLRG